MADVLDQWHYFVSPVYSINKPEFLSSVKEASTDSIKSYLKTNKVDDIYPLVQADLSTYDSLDGFYSYVVNTAWNLLNDQGYLMENNETYFTECWVQEYRKYASMDYHMHNDCMLNAFYMIDCSTDSMKAVFHDPRPGKLMQSLPEADMTSLSLATSTINFDLTPGTLLFCNSYVPHSFTRNSSNKPVRLVHMNINVRPSSPRIEYPATAEII